MKPLATAFVIALGATPAVAEEFRRVTDRDTFVSMVEGRELRLGSFGVSLQVKPNGEIEGRAMMAGVTGTWAWQDNYFCREMDWSGTEVPYNCQLVEVSDSGTMRFTVDRGAGRAATFSVN